MSNITYSAMLYRNAVCKDCLSNAFSTTDIINDHLFIFIKAQARSFALPPASIRQRLVACPIRDIK